MSALITTGSHPKDLWPGVYMHWGMEYDKYPKEYQDIFDCVSSDKAYEEMVEATGFGLAQIKSEGGAVTYDFTKQGDVTRATHVAVALGYIVTYEELKDNKYPEVSRARATANAFSMSTTKNTIGANVLNRAFNSTYVGGDGTELLATTHATEAGTQSNELSTAADLSVQALEDLCIQIAQAKNARGLQIRLAPQKLIVAPGNMFEAERILKSQLHSENANNAINALRSTGAIPGGFVVNHYLTDADAWFVKTNAPAGLTCFEREKISFSQDNDFDTKNAKAASYERYSFTWGDWRTLYGSPGA